MLTARILTKEKPSSIYHSCESTARRPGLVLRGYSWLLSVELEQCVQQLSAMHVNSLVFYSLFLSFSDQSCAWRNGWQTTDVMTDDSCFLRGFCLFGRIICERSPHCTSRKSEYGFGEIRKHLGYCGNRGVDAHSYFCHFFFLHFFSSDSMETFGGGGGGGGAF